MNGAAAPVELVGRLAAFCDETFGGRVPIAVERIAGGGSCEVFGVVRGDERWVLRRAPERANTSRAHDVMREFRILDAIKDAPVRIPRPVAGCADPDVFGSPFFLMERVDGVPVRAEIPAAWTHAAGRQADAVWGLLDALVAIHAVDWRACGLGDLAHAPGYLGRQIGRWLSQLRSYGGRELRGAERAAEWLRERLPPEQPQALCHGDYKLDNALFAESAPPDLLAVVDWEMASVGDPLVDLCWMLVFHPGAGGIMPLAVTGARCFDRGALPSADDVAGQYAARSGRDLEHLDWYQVFARWKMAIVLEGSYAKFQRGESDNPFHEHFGAQADRALEAALAVIGATT